MTPNMYWYLFFLARTQEKIPSGIDMVIYIEAPRETVLQRSLGRLFDDEELRKRLGCRARDTVMQRFSQQAVLERYLQLLDIHGVDKV